MPAIFLRDIPFNMLYFSSYAAFKKALRDENGEVGGMSVFAAGLGAGAIAGELGRNFLFYFSYHSCCSCFGYTSGYNQDPTPKWFRTVEMNQKRDLLSFSLSFVKSFIGTRMFDMHLSLF